MLTLLAEKDSESRRYFNLFVHLEGVSSDPLRLKAEATCAADFLSQTATESVYFKITPGELREAYDTIRSASQRGASRRGATPSLDPVKDLGARLFNALFQSKFGSMYRESVSHADAKDARLRMCISASPGTLIEDLPWEFLYDPMRNDFLALSSRRPIVRQVAPAMPSPISKPDATAPLRVAFMNTSDPDGDLEIERDWELLRQIHEAEPGRFEIMRIPSESA
jgi:hypothetical protein